MESGKVSQWPVGDSVENRRPLLMEFCCCSRVPPPKKSPIDRGAFEFLIICLHTCLYGVAYPEDFDTHQLGCYDDVRK